MTSWLADGLIGLLLALFALGGARSGPVAALVRVLTLVAVIAAVTLGANLIEQSLAPLMPVPEGVQPMAALGAAVLGIILAGFAFRILAGKPELGTGGALLGLMFGLAHGMLLILLMSFVSAFIPSTLTKGGWESSRLLPYFGQAAQYGIESLLPANAPETENKLVAILREIEFDPESYQPTYFDDFETPGGDNPLQDDDNDEASGEVDSEIHSERLDAVSDLLQNRQQ